MFHVPTDEQETVINFSRAGKGAWIYTSDSTMITKLDRLVATSDHYSLRKVGKVDGNPVDREYYVDDKSLISFRSKKVKMDLSEEQRQERAEKMRNLLTQ